MYYLQSRYYNPDWGRFINADTITGSTGELLTANMFAYSLNDPVNREDSDGNFSIRSFVKYSFLGTAIAAAAAITIVTCGAGGLVLAGVGSIGMGITDIAAIGMASTAGYGALEAQDRISYAKAGEGVTQHDKNARKSTKNKHQEGQTRKKRDSGGEKADKKRIQRTNPKKRNLR